MDEDKNENIENDVNEVSSVENTNVENDIKQETVNTFNEAKEKMKNINFKEEAEIGKGLFKKLFTNPREAIYEIAHDPNNSFFKTALLLVIIWAGLLLIREVIYYMGRKYFTFTFKDFLTIIKTTISPVLTIIALTASMYIFNKKSKKSLITTITAFTVAKIPVIVSVLLTYLRYISLNTTYITSPINAFLSVISAVLIYFAVKSLADEADESESLKLFIKVIGVYYIIYFALSFLGLYI